MPAIRRTLRALSVALRAVSTKRAVTVAAAVLLTLSTAAFPASRPVLPADTGEQFGEIHWYNAEKAPAEAGALHDD